MRKIWGAAGLAAVALAVSACGSSGSSSAASAPASSAPASSAPASSAPASSAPASSASAAAGGSTLMAKTIGGTRVLTNAQGFTLYWFVPDTPATSKCYGSCATYWPPVKGPATAAAGVTGKLGTIKRSDGAIQATYDGHPLYTFAGDTAPGEAKGNGLNASGGLWWEMTVSGATPAAGASAKASTGSGSGGY